MKYASKYYPFSFVRAASSPHPRTHTDARRFRCISILVARVGVAVCNVRCDLCRSAEVVATASNPWLLRVDSHAPSSAGGARRRESWTCGGPEPSREGTQDRRSRTSGESGRPAAHLLTAPHARRARTRDANTKYSKHDTKFTSPK